MVTMVTNEFVRNISIVLHVDETKSDFGDTSASNYKIKYSKVAKIKVIESLSLLQAEDLTFLIPSFFKEEVAKELCLKNAAKIRPCLNNY